MGIITGIKEVFDIKLGNKERLNGSNGARLGFSSMLSALFGYDSYDGYEVTTNEHKFLILISNGQSCCESWGYFSSNDDIQSYVGKTLISVDLTDKALNSKKVEESGYYDDCGGIQFVDFKFMDGSVLQFAVYNAHNGYYGHGIIISKDDDILCNDTL